MEHIGKAAERALRGGVKGRKDAQKQEKVIDLKIIKDRLPVSLLFDEIKV